MFHEAFRRELCLLIMERTARGGKSRGRRVLARGRAAAERFDVSKTRERSGEKYELKAGSE